MTRTYAHEELRISGARHDSTQYSGRYVFEYWQRNEGDRLALMFFDDDLVRTEAIRDDGPLQCCGSSVLALSCPA